jgi:hypothetical protein
LTASGRRAKLGQMKDHVAVRLRPEVIEKLDAIAVAKATKWQDPSRSDVLRDFVGDGIDAWEKEHGPIPVTVVHTERPVRELRPGRSELVKRKEARGVNPVADAWDENVRKLVGELGKKGVAK